MGWGHAATTELPLDGELAEYTKKLNQVRDKMIKGQNYSAVRMLDYLARNAPEPVRKQSKELLGVAFERVNNTSKAAQMYQEYIDTYRQGEDVVRIQQRLAHLWTSQLQARAPIRKIRTRRATRRSFNGSVSQRYFDSRSQYANVNTSNIDQSSLSSNLSTHWRQRKQSSDTRVVLNGRYLNDFTADKDKPLELSKAYVSYKNSRNGLRSRVGRQTGSNLGLIGKFDGAVVGLRLPRKSILQVFTGYPVNYMTKYTVNKAQQFYGFNLGFTPINNLEISPYLAEHRESGITTRNAIGNAVRYSFKGVRINTLTDYDFLYKQLNLFTSNVEARIGKYTWLLNYDKRKNPLLDMSTALIAVTEAQDLEELLKIMPEEEIYKLAEQLTGSATTTMLGVQRILTDNIDAGLDVSFSRYTYKQAAEDQSISSFSDQSRTLSGRVVFKEYTRYHEANIAGFSFLDASSYDNKLAYISSRWPLNRRWMLTGKLRYSLRTADTGTRQTRIYPGVEAKLRAGRKYNLQLNIGKEWSHYQGGSQNLDYTRLNWNLGYTYLF